MAKKPNFLNQLIKVTGNQYATVAEEGIVAGDISGYVDTGSFAFNALLSGSLFKGLASNKILGLAGEESTGKTFYALAIAKNFQDKDPEAFVVDFATESDFGKSTLEGRKIDTSRFLSVPVGTVEEFRTQCMKMVDMLAENADRPKALLILDSLGNLSTIKEIKDITEGNTTRDMTKQQLLKGSFRALTLKLGKLQIPMVVVNHTYQVIGSYIPMKEMCLASGTMISTPNGNMPIENMKIDDEVNTINGKEKISVIHEYNSEELFHIEFEDGCVVECTADHKFLIDGKWITAKTLLGMAQNTEILNIDVATIHDGNNDVYREQIYKNLYEINE